MSCSPPISSLFLEMVDPGTPFLLYEQYQTKRLASPSVCSYQWRSDWCRSHNLADTTLRLHGLGGSRKIYLVFKKKWFGSSPRKKWKWWFDGLPHFHTNRIGCTHSLIDSFSFSQLVASKSMALAGLVFTEVFFALVLFGRCGWFATDFLKTNITWIGRSTHDSLSQKWYFIPLKLRCHVVPLWSQQC